MLLTQAVDVCVKQIVSNADASVEEAFNRAHDAFVQDTCGGKITSKGRKVERLMNKYCAAHNDSMEFAKKNHSKLCVQARLQKKLQQRKEAKSTE